MEPREKFRLLKIAQDYNTLPLTSHCNLSCKFCSHRQNPPGVETYAHGHLQLELIGQLIDYLSPEGPIIIGESATRVIEGEPCLHPEFPRILGLIRDKWPQKEIRITTNGSLLDSRLVELFCNNRPLYLNISVNCASPRERAFLMDDPHPAQVFSGLELLAESKIPFSTSLVALPRLMGWDSLEDAVDLLAQSGPELIRVFYPGFTRYSRTELTFKPERLYPRLEEWCRQQTATQQLPVILEPPILKNFRAEIRGVIPDSPAAKAGIKPGEIITEVNGQPVVTRVGAFNRIKKSVQPELTIERKPPITLEKQGGERSGLVLDYDLDPGVLTHLRGMLVEHRGESLLLITSTMAEPLISRLIQNLQREFPVRNLETLAVSSQLFSGSIGSAGLLTNRDILAALSGVDNSTYDLLILPGIIYDIFGKDLNGSNYRELYRKTGIKTGVVELNK